MYEYVRNSGDIALPARAAVGSAARHELAQRARQQQRRPARDPGGRGLDRPVRPQLQHPGRRGAVVPRQRRVRPDAGTGRGTRAGGGLPALVADDQVGAAGPVLADDRAEGRRGCRFHVHRAATRRRRHPVPAGAGDAVRLQLALRRLRQHPRLAVQRPGRGTGQDRLPLHVGGRDQRPVAGQEPLPGRALR